MGIKWGGVDDVEGGEIRLIGEHAQMVGLKTIFYYLRLSPKYLILIIKFF